MRCVEGNVIKSPYGVFEVSDLVVFDLINSTAMQRISKVHQFGVMKCVKKLPDYSRFDHSIGVWALLRRFGAPLNEQLAGLLHDVSHTAFSHLGDYVFNHTSDTDSYQDDIHEWVLRRYGIDKVIAPYGISLKNVLHKNPAYRVLEQDLPDLCADRLEYNLQEGLQRGLINKKDIDDILNALRFENGQWFFMDQENAVKFAKVPLYLVEHVWGSMENFLVYTWAAQAIRRALDISLITSDEFHFSTDDLVWDKLVHATDPAICAYMKKVEDIEKYYVLADDSMRVDKVVTAKFRGIDPFVLSGSGLKRLTQIEASFAMEFERVKIFAQTGRKIVFL
jgi:uncharacterized protein